MAKVFHKFTYGAPDPVSPTRCQKCRCGGHWKVRMGAPEMKGDTEEHWDPKSDNGSCFPEKHLIVLNPELWKSPVKLIETFLHELFHAINHVEVAKDTKDWWLPHSVIKRVARALAKWLAENNMEIVMRKVVTQKETDDEESGM